LRDSDGGKTGRVEDLIGEGRKPDIDDDDTPIHSVLPGRRRDDHLNLHGHQNQVIATEEQEGQRPSESEHRAFAFSLYCYNPCIIYFVSVLTR
jgi:hypothetical protein